MTLKQHQYPKLKLVANISMGQWRVLFNPDASKQAQELVFSRKNTLLIKELLT